MRNRIPDEQSDAVGECLRYLCARLEKKDSGHAVTLGEAAAFAIVKWARHMEVDSAPAMSDFRSLMEE